MTALAGGLAGPPARLGGTFLQFWARHLEWDAARWERLFGYLEALGARELVVQWSAYDGIDYGVLVERVLGLAGSRGMRVRVGLRYESRWWAEVESAPGQALGRLAERAAGIGKGPPRVFEKQRAFAGWYLPEEIDDVHWRGGEAALALAEAVRATRKKVGRLSVSGFATGVCGAAELGAWWRRLAGRGGVDEVLFQDGIGAGKLSMETWPAYARALGKSLGGKLRVVVETFEAKSGPGEFSATPAGVERVLEQCLVAARCSRRAPLAFSLPEYWTPEGGAGAAERYREYLARMERS